jgi:Fur family ferric uptake transcriptional regulator
MINKNEDGDTRWLKTLKQYGYKVTSGRKAILRVLSNTAGHLTAEKVYFEVHHIHPDIGLASVYRTLDLLVGIGVVFKLDFGRGKAEYELAEDVKGKGHHHHLVCTGCGQVVDYKDFSKEELELLKRTEEGLLRRYTFAITNHLIQFYGLCKACSESKSRA